MLDTELVFLVTEDCAIKLRYHYQLVVVPVLGPRLQVQVPVSVQAGGQGAATKLGPHTARQLYFCTPPVHCGPIT